MRSYKVVLLTALVAAFSVTPLVAQVTSHSPYIYGIHTWIDGANADVMSNKGGYTLQSILTDSTSVNNEVATFQKAKNDGFTIICRLNWNYPEGGIPNRTSSTIPTPYNTTNRNAWGNEVANAVSKLGNYCNIWQIGNEMNIRAEQGSNSGQSFSCSNYVDCFKYIRTIIKQIQPNAIVCVGALSPVSRETDADIARYRNWGHPAFNYMNQLVGTIDNECDGYTLHTYGVDEDPRNDFNQYTDPFDFRFRGFQAYRQHMDIIGAYHMSHMKPVYITEFGNASYSAGWIQKAFEDVNTFNNSRRQKIQAMCYFLYYDCCGVFCDFAIREEPGNCLSLTSVGTMASQVWNQQAWEDFRATTSGTNYTNTGPNFSSFWPIDIARSNMTGNDPRDIKEGPWDCNWSYGGALISGSGSIPSPPRTDYFVIWSACEFRETSSGTKWFATQTDDGSWMWVDWFVPVSNGGQHSIRWKDGSCTLQAGPHFMVYKMFDATGGFQSYYGRWTGSSWAALRGCGALGATNVWTITGNPNSDWNGVVQSSYKGSLWWNGQLLSYGSGGPFGLTDNYMLDQVKYFWANTSGTYQFRTNTDDGSWLWVDGYIVVDNGGIHGPTVRTGSIYLTRGWHIMNFRGFEWGGSATFQYDWIPAGQTAWQSMPAM